MPKKIKLATPQILQINDSYIITDPSGSMFMNNGETLRRFGYNVRVFDLVQMGNCNTYNPLKYCYKESDIKKLVQAFINNTDTTGNKYGGNKDPFWDDSMNVFLCACIGFLVTKPKGMNCTYAQIPEITGGMCYEACFSNLTELACMANSKWTPDCGIRLYNNVKLGGGTNNTANVSKLAAIFENLRVWEAERQGLGPEEMDIMQKPYCLCEWDSFRIAPEKTSTSILMTTVGRLDAFNIEQVKNLTSTDTINLDTFANQRDALFLIIPFYDRTYNFLISFIYEQLFDILYTKNEAEILGSKDFKLACGELVKHFSREEVEEGKADEAVTKMKAAKIKYRGSKDTIMKGHIKKKKPILFRLFGIIATNKTVIFDDSWYDIIDKDGALISRRPTKALAEAYVKDLQTASLLNAHQPTLPYNVQKFNYSKHKDYKYTHDYCEEIGIKYGALFDRSVFKTNMAIQTIYPADLTEILPKIPELTIDELLSSVYTGDVEEALKRFGNDENIFEDMTEETEEDAATKAKETPEIEDIFKKDNIPEVFRKKTGASIRF